MHRLILGSIHSDKIDVNYYVRIRKGIHLDLDTWIVPGQILTGKPPPESGKQLQTSWYQGVDLSRSTRHPTAIPGGAECHHWEHPQFCAAQRHTPASPECQPGVKRVETAHRDFVLKGPVRAKGQSFAQVGPADSGNDSIQSPPYWPAPGHSKTG